MTIQKLKEELSLTDADIAKMFGYANANSYANAKRKTKLDAGIIELYKRIEEKKNLLEKKKNVSRF